ncbi:BRCA1-A complex subunit RAP80 isoform X4 [Mirounga leonina]|uniref:BRCA1-A complex subunit RAP80 isoform X4 n=2 Tax=Mirounga TaxID=9714 RepID=UPI00156C45EE|nr:BRCA1-A complex subunit RAP80 isoform X4 [Mirounga leonina]
MIQRTSPLRARGEGPTLRWKINSYSSDGALQPERSGMTWPRLPPAVRVGCVPGRRRTRPHPPGERDSSPRCLSFARVPPPPPPPRAPDVLRTLATRSAPEEGLGRGPRPVDERMPRRKKKVKEASEAQNLEKKDAETASSVNLKRKRRLEDAFIVISDSDGEEPKEENGLQKMKTKQSNRTKCLAKRKIAQMTEEEQFALALKMSEQEAREMNSQEEEEEELLRKAIAESLNSSQGPFVEETSEEGNSVPASQSIAALTSKRSSVLMPESSAEESTVCPETQLSSPETFDLEKEVSPGSREILDEVRIIMADKEVGNRGNAEKEIPISAVSSSTQVSCPLCDQGFPPTKIERHAMYCNGLIGQDTVLTRRQKEAKSKSDSGTAVQTSLDIDKNEKCYLCKSVVPFREYQSHVESCLQLARGDQGAGPEESGKVCSAVEEKQQQQLRNPKEKNRSEGRLLSLLEQSEHKTADAEIKTKSSETGSFRVPSPGMEEAGCSKEMQSSLPHLNLNESPIKSFVSISEATDCLVDFKKQLTVRPGSRTRTKAGRGRRRKP